MPKRDIRGLSGALCEPCREGLYKQSQERQETDAYNRLTDPVKLIRYSPHPDDAVLVYRVTGY